MVLHALKTTDGLAEDDPLARIFVGEFKNFLTGAHLIGAKDGQRFFQSVVDNPPAGAGADYITGCDFHLLELNFGHRDGKAGVNS